VRLEHVPEKWKSALPRDKREALPADHAQRKDTVLSPIQSVESGRRGASHCVAVNKTLIRAQTPRTFDSNVGNFALLCERRTNGYSEAKTIIEKLSAPRHRVFKHGTVAFRSGGSVDCTVRNISSSGARIDVAIPIRLPQSFHAYHRGRSIHAPLPPGMKQQSANRRCVRPRLRLRSNAHWSRL
jgi:hypothetical protein